MPDVKKLFSSEFLESGKYNPTNKSVIHLIERGGNPYTTIEVICMLLSEVNQSLINIKINGPQPQIIVTTQEHYDKMVSEKIITDAG